MKYIHLDVLHHIRAVWASLVEPAHHRVHRVGVFDRNLAFAGQYRFQGGVDSHPELRRDFARRRYLLHLLAEAHKVRSVRSLKWWNPVPNKVGHPAIFDYRCFVLVRVCAKDGVQGMAVARRVKPAATVLAAERGDRRQAFTGLGLRVRQLAGLGVLAGLGSAVGAMAAREPLHRVKVVGDRAAKGLLGDLLNLQVLVLGKHSHALSSWVNL